MTAPSPGPSVGEKSGCDYAKCQYAARKDGQPFCNAPSEYCVMRADYIPDPAPLPAEVEEAMWNLGNVLTDAYDFAWAGKPGEEKYANAQAALAVIRAALSGKK